MPALSSAAWILHDLSLATIVGGQIFAKAAFHPSTKQLRDPAERDQVMNDAWKRFSILNTAAHVAVLATWLPGRKMLSGREVSKTARTLTIVKDGLIAASLATGVASMLLGRVLGQRTARHAGPAEAQTEHQPEATTSRSIERGTALLGTLNLLATAGVAGVTTALSMESSKSARFGLISRMLP